ncbi:hypothetical protein [Klebsiella oxytoca]
MKVQRPSSPATTVPSTVSPVDRDRGARLGGTAQGRRGVVSLTFHRRSPADC